MFDVGDLPVLTFGNCVLKTGVIKWPLKLYVRFLNVLTFFFKNVAFTFFELLHTFIRTLGLTAGLRAGPRTCAYHNNIKS